MKHFKHLLHRSSHSFGTHSADEDYITRRPHKKRRLYVYSPGKNKQQHAVFLLCGAICILVFCISAFKLTSYAKDYFTAHQASDTLREIYHAEPVPSASAETITPAIQFTPAPSSESNPIPTSVVPPARLESSKYPYNPYFIISDRFKTIQRQNKDIIGWLTIDGLLDEAVVQRDNDYYLTRDYRGYHNDNGAIFLDQHCDLSTRPYTYLVYGHNMKTGLMFGSLRNYEDITFYRNNPFITFDTMYEDGCYVIFAVATVSTDPSHWRYVDFANLHSSVIASRQKALQTLIARSKYRCTIDIQPHDQVLLLVTCVDDDTDRRVVAARRIREDETEESLKRLVRKTTNR